MKRIEQRSVQVTYCDVCGAEIKGNSTTFRKADGTEVHGCEHWHEDKSATCAMLLTSETQPFSPADPVPS